METEQEPASVESQERAVSSEPRSIRPNPFDEAELSSARKRRRTSRAGSGSRSSTDSMSREESVKAVALSDTNMMESIPEPAESVNAAPSTPPHADLDSGQGTSTSEQASRVTLNLLHRNVNAHPPSPTPARWVANGVKVSVEESEVEMISVEDGPSPTVSSESSSDIPGKSTDDMDDFEPVFQHIHAGAGGESYGGQDIADVLIDLPWHSADETTVDTVNRLLNFMNQPGAQLDEIMVAWSKWLDRLLVRLRQYDTLAISPWLLEQRPLWHILPELFWSACRARSLLLKDRDSRHIAGQFFLRLSRLAAYFLYFDDLILNGVPDGTPPGDVVLLASHYLQCLGHMTRRDESSYQSHAMDELPEPSTLLDAFYAANPPGNIETIRSVLQTETRLLSTSPKRTMDYLCSVCLVTASLVADSAHRLSRHPLSTPRATRDTRTLSTGLAIFHMVAAVLDEVVEKFVNHLPGETGTQLIESLTKIYDCSLQGLHTEEASNEISRHRELHPDVPGCHTVDTIVREWRIRTLSKLIRSRQMQLRVAAVSCMCNDLILQWKRTNQDASQEDLERVHIYLRYLSGCLRRTGLVDYILGPTCHPEITHESYNVIGFLVVTKTYTPAETDLLWQTVSSTQDPRVAEALIRMIIKITHLMVLDSLLYLCDKLNSLSVDAFTPHMRELADTVFKVLSQKVGASFVPMSGLQLCVRMIQESAIYGPDAYPDVHQFAVSKFKELAVLAASEVRLGVVRSCVQDIASKSRTTTGSIHALFVLIRNSQQRDMVELISQYDLIRLMIDELEATIAAARSSGSLPVYASHIGIARRELLFTFITNHAPAIDTHQGRRLWDLLVGDGAACQEDRKCAWLQLTTAAKRGGFGNSFLSACLNDFLPTLSPHWYCDSALEFLREAVLPLTRDANAFADGEIDETGPIELLWHMILTAPNGTIESQAIQTLVHDVYVDSKFIDALSLHGARKVHFGLLNRCLRQLKAAAEKLKTFSDGTVSGDDEPMVIVPTDEQQREQELKFTRSLAVLRAFLSLLQSNVQFAAPDLRSLMLRAPGAVEGPLAVLKYQAFDGDQQTTVNPLTIGLRNTAASLLASLREATGFENYRMFYRGCPLTLTQNEICRSLEELKIHSGLILVKKEEDGGSSPTKIRPGASPFEIEILGHFKDLWSYLSMEEPLAREVSYLDARLDVTNVKHQIHDFLVRLPADESFLEAFESRSTSHRDVFPLGEPFKCLYAIHALREYMSTRRLESRVMCSGEGNGTNDLEEALLKTMTLLVAAICDPEVLGRCTNENLRVKLSFHLVENFGLLLKELHKTSAVHLLDARLYTRLRDILVYAVSAKAGTDLINRCIEAMLESCARSSEIWAIFKQCAQVKEVVQRLLLEDGRPTVRKSIAKLIGSKSFYDHAPTGVLALDFAELFWPVVSELLPQAASRPSTCEEAFNLSFQLFKMLAEANSGVLDLAGYLSQCGELLLAHTTKEDISQPHQKDVVSHGLLLLLHHGISSYSNVRSNPALFPRDYAMRLFRKHLFVPDDRHGPLVPPIILNSASRHMTYEIVLSLASQHEEQYRDLLQALNDLTPYHHGRDVSNPYKYEMSQSFDRGKHVRSPCGYSGLRNLSNTCYLNSLFTQLFMNASFRRFVLETPVGDADTHQLLAETKALFASLQDSVRRFVDPQSCISQITTYDETPIDIHVQMDVDEVYNLLFDRWEAQMPSDEAKRTLRSIFGGQLVQQVKSKECDHVSERIEPFSAIQCDIKGKASLEESLQAYVDGEIMEGDNKYKCGTCDRHVDAVKRACLKDIPDNLIFHLKRFDFNLRILQRSKINDYFSFPRKINMQQYTVEHLSDPSLHSEPDVFELVGVLVHSGTAETGHYYSYIRERPTGGQRESWVEFNDEMVSTWDPENLEHSCFGGPEYRPQFDHTPYDKAYSAYMLFYQRSSSLQAEEKFLECKAGPLRFDLPQELETLVKVDNWATVQRHCLHDPTHVPMVQKVLGEIWNGPCPADHSTKDLAMRVALGHMDQVASRTKDTPDFESLSHMVNLASQGCGKCSLALVDYFKDKTESLRFLLQRNSDGSIRADVGHTLICAMASVKQNFPAYYGVANGDDEGPLFEQATHPGLVTAIGDRLTELFETFHTAIRAWPDYFGTLVDFVELGKAEAVVLLANDFLLKLIMIVSSDATFDLPPQFARMINVVSKKLGNGRPASYENIVNLLDHLMSLMDARSEPLDDARDRLDMATARALVRYTNQEIFTLHRDWSKDGPNLFAEKLIALNQNPEATNAVLAKLLDLDMSMDSKVYVTILQGVSGQMVVQPVSAFLRAAVTYVQNSSSDMSVNHLIRHVCDQCRVLVNGDGRAFFEFHKEIFDSVRRTEESIDRCRCQGLANVPRWAPFLLGYMDRDVSFLTESFLVEELFKHGPSPNFGASEAAHERAVLTVQAVRELALACLLYLRDTYVARGIQAPRDIVDPLERCIKRSIGYFDAECEQQESADWKYAVLSREVLEPLGQLMVDEIEDDASGTWSESDSATLDDELMC